MWLACINGAPNVDHCNERDEAEDRAGEEVEAVSEVVLNPDVEDVITVRERPSVRETLVLVRRLWRRYLTTKKEKLGHLFTTR